MKTVYFESIRNEWYMPVIVKNKRERAFLGVHFADAESEATTRARELLDVLCGVVEEEEAECGGLLLNYSDDFRVMIAEVQ